MPYYCSKPTSSAKQKFYFKSETITISIVQTIKLETTRDNKLEFKKMEKNTTIHEKKL